MQRGLGCCRRARDEKEIDVSAFKDAEKGTQQEGELEERELKQSQ